MDWRYLLYCQAYFFEGYVKGYTPNFYGLKYGTDVPPFQDPGIPIELLGYTTATNTWCFASKQLPQNPQQGWCLSCDVGEHVTDYVNKHYGLGLLMLNVPQLS